jgi:alpha-D-xyloside xylohydrolase
MELMRQAHEEGAPPMRPLFYDFPADATCWGIEDQFMFGPDLLVAPVLFEGARSRRVYFPAGTGWCDGWTDEELAGGQWIEADAPLERIPLYVRAGRALPIRP